MNIKKFLKSKWIFLIPLISPLFLTTREYVRYKAEPNPLCCWKYCYPCTSFRHWLSSSGLRYQIVMWLLLITLSIVVTIIHLIARAKDNKRNKKPWLTVVLALLLFSVVGLFVFKYIL